jgi:mannan endo-1,4-beta-mannosidase
MTMVNILAPHNRPYSFANAVLVFSGGMDAYVREFTKTQTHDEFYTDQTIRGFFENYLSVVVARYADSTTLLGWELANDARCASSLAASPSCNTQTITLWHSDIAKFISSIDANHLITSGYVYFRSLAWIPI